MIVSLAIAVATKAPISIKLGLPELDRMVIYEENLRAEGGSQAFVKFSKRLPTIKKLGVNVIWLMPIYPVGKLRSAGGLGSPYAVADFDSVSPEFGTEADVRNLITAIHKQDMFVILDWVPNHTAWDHSWITKHPEWYAKNEKGEMIPPPGTNWNDVAELNYDSSSLREAMTTSMVGWVKKFDIDGFRVDTADWVPDDYWKSAVPTIRKSTNKKLLMLAEGFRKEHYDAGFELTYAWPFFDKVAAVFKGEAATQINKVSLDETKGLPKGAKRLRFVTNHDKSAWEGSPTEFFSSPAGVRAASVITYLYPNGIPLIYSGQEVAWESRIPIFDSSTIDWNDKTSETQFISKLMALRAKSPFNATACTDFSNNDVVAFSVGQGTISGLTLVNVRNKPVTFKVSKSYNGKWIDSFTRKPLSIGSEVTLKPFEFKIVTRD